MPTKLTNTIIEAAIDGFEAQKQRINAQIAELRAMLADTSETSAEEVPAKGKRRKFSLAARKRMKEAQQLRWAKIRGESGTTIKSAKPKRRLSAAGREAIAAAMRKRWAAKKAGGGQSAAAAKKPARKKAA